MSKRKTELKRKRKAEWEQRKKDLMLMAVLVHGPAPDVPRGSSHARYSAYRKRSDWRGEVQKFLEVQNTKLRGITYVEFWDIYYELHPPDIRKPATSRFDNYAKAIGLVR